MQKSRARELQKAILVITQIAMQTRLFPRFEQRPNRGRPRESRQMITSSGDPRLRWTSRHSDLLNKLPAQPLAFHFQAEVRRWWVRQWDMCVNEWEKEPSLYPKFSQKDEQSDWDERLPPEDLRDPNNRLFRDFRMIQESPIVTIKTLQRNGLTHPMISDLARFYWFAADEYSGSRPPLVEQIPGHPYMGNDYDMISIRRDMGTKRKRALFNEWGERGAGRGWGFNPRSLGAYDILHYIDLRIFELVSEVNISSAVKINIIRTRRENASHSESNFRVREHELVTTHRRSVALLDLFSTSSSELEWAANIELLNLWKKASGEGDGRFVPSVRESDLWPL
jgi:hypothetical protein